MMKKYINVSLFLALILPACLPVALAEDGSTINLDSMTVYLDMLMPSADVAAVDTSQLSKPSNDENILNANDGEYLTDKTHSASGGAFDPTDVVEVAPLSVNYFISASTRYSYRGHNWVSYTNI